MLRIGRRAMIRNDILLIDNNAVRRLADPSARQRLRTTLRATGREFWPSAINVLEALSATDPDLRTLLLRTLGGLAGMNHVLTLPTEALKRYAAAIASGSRNVDISEPNLTAFIREPIESSDEHVETARVHLRNQEQAFRAAHERARVELREPLKEAGGIRTWPNLGSCLDNLWSQPSHLGDYVQRLWEEWEHGGPAPVDELLRHPAWRLFLEGWGAAAYSVALAHPQPRWVETADFQQLVYIGFASTAVLATDDVGLLEVGNAMLRGRYPMSQVVRADEIM